MSTEKSSIAEKTAELDVLVGWFDGDDFELEQALDKYKEAEKLASEIENDLAKLKNEITIIKKRFDEAE